MAKTVRYTARKLQSHFDLAVQLYGDVSQIGEILKNVSDINGEIPLGTVFSYPEQTDPIAVFFRDKVVQTDFEVDAPLFFTADNTLIKADSTLLTADQTVY